LPTPSLLREPVSIGTDAFQFGGPRMLGLFLFSVAIALLLLAFSLSLSLLMGHLEGKHTILLHNILLKMPHYSQCIIVQFQLTVQKVNKLLKLLN
jgi:hypothetical protein